MISSPEHNQTLSSVNARSQLAFWLSLLAFMAFGGIFWLVTHAPLVVTDDFGNRGAIYSTDPGTRVMLILTVILWAVLLLTSIGVEVSVLAQTSKGSKPVTGLSTAFAVIAFFLIALHLAVLAIVVGLGTMRQFSQIGVEYIWGLISNP